MHRLIWIIWRQRKETRSTSYHLAFESDCLLKFCHLPTFQTLKLFISKRHFVDGISLKMSSRKIAWMRSCWRCCCLPALLPVSPWPGPGSAGERVVGEGEKPRIYLNGCKVLQYFICTVYMYIFKHKHGVMYIHTNTMLVQFSMFDFLLFVNI